MASVMILNVWDHFYTWIADVLFSVPSCWLFYIRSKITARDWDLKVVVTGAQSDKQQTQCHASILNSSGCKEGSGQLSRLSEAGGVLVSQEWDVNSSCSMASVCEWEKSSVCCRSVIDHLVCLAVFS